MALDIQSCARSRSGVSPLQSECIVVTNEHDVRTANLLVGQKQRNCCSRGRSAGTVRAVWASYNQGSCRHRRRGCKGASRNEACRRDVMRTSINCLRAKQHTGAYVHFVVRYCQHYAASTVADLNDPIAAGVVTAKGAILTCIGSRCCVGRRTVRVCASVSCGTGACRSIVASASLNHDIATSAAAASMRVLALDCQGRSAASGVLRTLERERIVIA